MWFFSVAEINCQIFSLIKHSDNYNYIRYKFHETFKNRPLNHYKAWLRCLNKYQIKIVDHLLAQILDIEESFSEFEHYIKDKCVHYYQSNELRTLFEEFRKTSLIRLEDLETIELKCDCGTKVGKKFLIVDDKIDRLKIIRI